MISRIVRSLRAFGFFVFYRRHYPDVINVLRLTNTLRLFRISELDGGKGYYILEPDTAACAHECRERCPEGPLNSRCLSECLHHCRSRVLESLLSSLTGYTAYPAPS